MCPLPPSADHHTLWHQGEYWTTAPYPYPYPYLRAFVQVVALQTRLTQHIYRWRHHSMLVTCNGQEHHDENSYCRHERPGSVHCLLPQSTYIPQFCLPYQSSKSTRSRVSVFPLTSRSRILDSESETGRYWSLPTMILPHSHIPSEELIS